MALSLSLLSFATLAQTPELRLARFQGDRAAALSLTFDDNHVDQYDVAAPMLAEAGLHGTFFVIAGVTSETQAEAAERPRTQHGTISWEKLRELAAAGHEIANHSWSHKQLTKVDDAELAHQVNDAYDLIKEKMGAAPLTFCYPGNGRNEHVRDFVLQRHVFSRDFQVGYGGPKWTAELADARIEQAIGKKEWVVAMIHGIIEGYQPTGKEALQAHLTWLKGQRDRVWIDTFANVARYVKERDAARLEGEVAPGRATITLTSPLDDRYNVPLTVLIPAAGAAEPQARRGDAPLPARLVGDTIQVDAPPSSEPITVTWKTAQ